MCKALKNKKGFTLVELIASIAIIVVVLAVISGIFTFSLNVYTTSMDNYMARTTSQIVMQKIQNEIKYSNSVSVDSTLPSTLNAGTNYLYSSSGSLIISSGTSIQDTFPDASKAAQYNCSVSFTASSAKTVDVTITITKNSKTLYTTTTSIFILGLINGAVGGTIGSAGTALEYQ